jgi:hypothetical protein
MLVKCDFNSTFALHAMHNINFSIDNHCNEGPVAQLNTTWYLVTPLGKRPRGATE